MNKIKPNNCICKDSDWIVEFVPEICQMYMHDVCGFCDRCGHCAECHVELNEND